MSSRPNSEFPFPSDVFTGPFVSSLPATEQVAIVKLWAWAWLNGGRVPIADARAMGQISALGDAWPTSSLATSAGRHFTEDGQPIALIAPFTRREEWRAKCAEGGRRSGVSRRQTKGSSRVVPPPPPHPRTTVELPFKYPSTTVPKIDATPIQETECATMAPPIPNFSATRQDFPPIPPLRETSFIESTSQGGGGGTGGGEGGFALVPDPTVTEIEGLVRQVSDAYAESVRPAEPVNERARSNIRSLLKRGTDVGQLIDACRNYGDWCDRAGREAQYRKAPHNFFSRKEAVWRQHVGQRVIGGMTGLACFAERLKTLCPTAEGWFFTFGEQHAARNDFSKPDDPQRLATWWATFHQMNVTQAEAEEASLWMTSKPKVANRAANRDLIVNRIRHLRLTPRQSATPTPSAVPETPRRTGFEYLVNDPIRQRLAPHEFVDGVITDAALVLHGFKRDGSPLAGLEKGDFDDRKKLKPAALNRLGYTSDGKPMPAKPAQPQKWSPAPR